MIKKCSKCGEEKPATLEYFYKNGNALHSECKPCSAERAKAYRKEKKEAIAEQKRAYYEAKKESILKQKKAYREAEKESILKQRRAFYRTPKGKWRSIKSVAKQRNINFSLPFKLYESKLWGKPCHYCGCEIEVTGLDRKDNDKGYEMSNVVPCCQNCNAKKKDRPYQVFIEEMINE